SSLRRRGAALEQAANLWPVECATGERRRSRCDETVEDDRDAALAEFLGARDGAGEHLGDPAEQKRHVARLDVGPHRTFALRVPHQLARLRVQPVALLLE